MGTDIHTTCAWPVHSTLCLFVYSKVIMSEVYESVVSPVSKRYMRAGIGNDRLLVCLSEYLPWRNVYSIYSMSSLGVCFAQRSPESSRKSCSCRRFRFNPFPPRRPGVTVFGRDRVLVFVSSSVMISIKSIDVHIGHESSVGVYFAKKSRIYRIESAIRHG